jgi:hypothetical protein
MLKDAALLHLEILERAITAGWILKDASAYNVQWRGVRPVFIDIPSFVPYKVGAPWGGYRQFCMMFLYPLMIAAYRGIDYLPFLRSSLEGIDPDTANRILSGASRLRRGVIGHVYLHSKMQKRYASQDLAEAKKLKGGSSPKKRNEIAHTLSMVLGTIQALRGTVDALSFGAEQTAWANYKNDHSYDVDSLEAKKQFVHGCIEFRRPTTIWDFGCNTGIFSRIAAPYADHVVAFDQDAAAVQALYNDLKSAGPNNILPLVINLANLSPDQGWRGRERQTLEKRGKPELILSLALIHHIVISSNIPVLEFASWLRDFDADIVLEWVGPDDPMTQMLLRNRTNQYDDLLLGNFECILSRHFKVIRSQILKDGLRKIFHLTPVPRAATNATQISRGN